jgi:glutathionyl-hydroquinone reductase
LKVVFRHLLSFFISVTAFRNSIKDDPSAEYPAEPNRYHLYVALACPWVNIQMFIFAKIYFLILGSSNTCFSEIERP